MLIHAKWENRFIRTLKKQIFQLVFFNGNTSRNLETCRVLVAVSLVLLCWHSYLATLLARRIAVQPIHFKIAEISGKSSYQHYQGRIDKILELNKPYRGKVQSMSKLRNASGRGVE